MQQALFYTILSIFIATAILTLLGISKKIEIEDKYLNGLYKALLLELIAAVLYLFASTDFFNQSGNTNDFMDAKSSECIEKLEECSQIKSILSAQNPSYEVLLTQVDDLEKELKSLQENNDTSKELKKRLAKLEKSFFVKMAHLNSEIADWGMSINFTWEPDKKRAIARKLQDAFKEIGFLEGEPNDNPLVTHKLLIRYQEEKGFKHTGYSSLSYLRRFPIDNLKIDRSFIRNVETNESDAAIVSAIIAMAQSLNLNVIAEGIENEEQLAFISEKGCQIIQGYYFSPPLPKEEIIKMLTNPFLGKNNPQ